jgi:hypothetical protein
VRNGKSALSFRLLCDPCLRMQINCSYFSAVGNKDQWYLLARAIQFFTPGIPLVYYVGLLAGANDIELVEHTKNGRDINRHSYSLDEAVAETDRPVVKARGSLGSWLSRWRDDVSSVLQLRGPKLLLRNVGRLLWFI